MDQCTNFLESFPQAKSGPNHKIVCIKRNKQQNRFDVFLDLIGNQLILEAAAQQDPKEPPEASRADLNRSFNWASIFPHTHTAQRFSSFLNLASGKKNKTTSVLKSASPELETSLKPSEKNILQDESTSQCRLKLILLFDQVKEPVHVLSEDLFTPGINGHE